MEMDYDYKPRKWLINFDQAKEGLYIDQVYAGNGFSLHISDAKSASDPELLSGSKIEAILSLVNFPGENKKDLKSQEGAAEGAGLLEKYIRPFPVHTALNIHRYQILLEDGQENTQQDLQQAFALLKELTARYKSILVHCHAGNSRSVLLTGAVISDLEDQSLEESLKGISESHQVAAKLELAEPMCLANSIVLDS